MDEREELLKKIKILEDQLEYYRMRDAQMEQMLQEYNQFIKRQFELYDDFVKDIGTSRIVDPMTRVYSQEHMSRLITYYHQKAFEENRSYAIVMVRLCEKDEHFEKHLAFIGKLLKNVVRVPMDSVGKVSEDTFVILLTDVNKENAQKVVERIKDSLKRGVDANTKVSFKVYPNDGEDLQKMIQQLQSEVV
ncbi:MAG TPA: diguanylate cyclase [Pseudothermotoga sp.]|nr:diguanylate cyclase [Pseudothermotoga sp.]HOK83586.1 diguanylate cyclase [Pseudothermotoga sp.]HPP71003.1 diguanylate cyclase [Pseudothermotoga sp.]